MRRNELITAGVHYQGGFGNRVAARSACMYEAIKKIPLRAGALQRIVNPTILLSPLTTQEAVLSSDQLEEQIQNLISVGM